MKRLYQLCLARLVRNLARYIERHAARINFFNQFDRAAREFEERVAAGRGAVQETLVGGLRWDLVAAFLGDSRWAAVRDIHPTVSHHIKNKIR